MAKGPAAARCWSRCRSESARNPDSDPTSQTANDRSGALADKVQRRLPRVASVSLKPAWPLPSVFWVSTARLAFADELHLALRTGAPSSSDCTNTSCAVGVVLDQHAQVREQCTSRFILPVLILRAGSQPRPDEEQPLRSLALPSRYLPRSTAVYCALPCACNWQGNVDDLRQDLRDVSALKR